MSGCTNEGPFDGGTYNDITINRPEIIGGKLTNTELSDVFLTNNITMDDAVAQKIASSICEYVKRCVEFPAEDVAAVFKDCGGKSHVPGAQVPTCAEMNTAIVTAITPVVSTSLPIVSDGRELPVKIIGQSRDKLLGEPDTYIQWGEYLVPAYTPTK